MSDYQRNVAVKLPASEGPSGVRSADQAGWLSTMASVLPSVRWGRPGEEATHPSTAPIAGDINVEVTDADHRHEHTHHENINNYGAGCSVYHYPSENVAQAREEFHRSTKESYMSSVLGFLTGGLKTKEESVYSSVTGETVGGDFHARLHAQLPERRW
jgi:hypothetical protein